jgi:hypothetical protein
MFAVKAKDRKINIRQHQVHWDILKTLPHITYYFS